MIISSISENKMVKFNCSSGRLTTFVMGLQVRRLQEICLMTLASKSDFQVRRRITRYLLNFLVLLLIIMVLMLYRLQIILKWHVPILLYSCWNLMVRILYYQKRYHLKPVHYLKMLYHHILYQLLLQLHQKIKFWVQQHHKVPVLPST